MSVESTKKSIMRSSIVNPLICLLLTVSFSGYGGNNLTIKKAEDQSSSIVQDLSPAEVRAIAKEAYIYAFPMVDSYRILNAYFVNKASPEYKGPFNTLINTARVFTPQDKTVQTPNSDTPYSFAGLDLTTEPYVITVPPIEKDRYFSIQLIDFYTFNFDYIGSRTTGNGGGNYLIVGPGWNGETPKNINKVIHSETKLLLSIVRTQLFNEADIENVKKIQAGYKLQPLSSFLGKPAPTTAPAVNFIKPLTSAEEKNSLQIFNILNFQLQYCPTHPSEVDLMKRFAQIGIGAGMHIDTTKLSAETISAMHEGIKDAWAAFVGMKEQVEKGEVTASSAFGTREFLKNNYLYRMGAAVIGIYGNSKEEAIYIIYSDDSIGKKLDGKNKYKLHFEPGKLPPANSFWSVTMYELPSSLLVDNSTNRYLINSPMLPELKKDADGGITLHIQNTSPGKDIESNWLPSPTSSFMTVLRVYWPKEEALNGTWKEPKIIME